ncbi:MAG: zinc-binding dehydrogenase [Deinococcota bacterium]
MTLTTTSQTTTSQTRANSKATIPQTMRALVLRGASDAHLAIEQVPVPRPGSKQVLARVDAAGICTSLLKLIAQGREHPYLYGWDLTAYPLILGDEGSVTLVEVGADVQGQYEVGQRYVVQPAVDHAPINHLERYANDGRGVHKVAVGYTLPGHLAEYMLIPEEVIEAGCLVPVSDDLPYSHATLAEPLSCVVSAQAHHLRVEQASPQAARAALNGLKPSGVVVIIGAGAMGRMHVDIALSRNPRAVVVVDVLADRLNVCEKLFRARATRSNIAFHTLTSSDDLNQHLRTISERGADDVIVAVGVPRAIQDAQALLARGGVLNLFGGLKRQDAQLALDTTKIHYDEIIITGSSGGTPWDVAESLALMQQAAIDASVHITRIGDLSHAKTLLEQVRQQNIDGKAVVYPHRQTTTIHQVERWTADDERRYLALAD